METEKRFAILIDADNVSADYIDAITTFIDTEGIASYKRVYGDFTSPGLREWSDILFDCALTPVQQFAYVKGKNATDFALIIDAMDILYSGGVDGFCIVSSDSDYTRLAIRLREAGMLVYGMGEAKTPRALIRACDRFVVLDANREKAPAAKKKAASKTEKSEKTGKTEKTAKVEKPVKEAEKAQAADPIPQTEEEADASAITPLAEIKRDIADLCLQMQDDDGWTMASIIGDQLRKRHPEFDIRNYGSKKTLTVFLRALGTYEVSKKGENVVIRPKKSPNL